MSKDPWKKAHDLSRSRQDLPPPGAAALQRQYGAVRPRARVSLGLVVGIIIAALVLGAGAAYWARALWWPQASGHLPEQVSQAVETAVPELRPSVDWHALDQGLGADLRQFTSYLDFVNNVRQWGAGDQLKLISTGDDHWRVTAPGLRVYVQDGLTWTYELELRKIYADDGWKPWWPTLRAAGLVPELSWEDVSSQPAPTEEHYEFVMRRTPATRVREGWVYPVYKLHFDRGKLSSMEAAVEFGVSEPLPSGEGKADTGSAGGGSAGGGK
jgi:hypothetical protein